MKKTKIEISQWEAQEIGRMLMNYGLVLDVINSTRGIPSSVAGFIEKRRTSDFKKVNLRVERLMIKFLTALNQDHDHRTIGRGSEPQS